MAAKALLRTNASGASVFVSRAGIFEAWCAPALASELGCAQAVGCWSLSLYRLPVCAAGAGVHALQTRSASESANSLGNLGALLSANHLIQPRKSRVLLSVMQRVSIRQGSLKLSGKVGSLLTVGFWPEKLRHEGTAVQTLESLAGVCD